MDDLELWNLMLKGDKKPLELLYRKYYELLLNYGLKVKCDEDLVKDAIQDLFVKLCNGKYLLATQYVRAYLLKSLRNILYDKLSAVKPMQNVDELPFELWVDEDFLSVVFEDCNEGRVRAKKIMEVYRLLPNNQRMAIYLRYIKGLSYKEMAEVLGINPQSSMNLVSRALTKLRSKLSNDDFLFIFSFIFFQYK